jgi:hypothetical protein
MLPEPGFVAAAQQARAKLAAARSRLLKPDLAAIGACAADLEEVAATLRTLECPIPLGTRPAVHEQMHELKRELSQLRMLLEGAGRFYAGWAEMVLGSAETYTPEGTIAASRAHPRLAVEA